MYKNEYIRVNCFPAIGEKFDMSAEDADKRSKNTRIRKRKTVLSGFAISIGKYE